MPTSAPREPSNQKTPTGLEQRLLARAREAGLARGDHLVVGFSGGRDSLALAAALRRVHAALDVESLLVHVDHRLRPTSGDDARRVGKLAVALGYDPRVIPVAAPPQSIHPGVGIEEAARRERYRLLFNEANEVGARAVVTAHHQDDQAETVLLHLLRGGGVRGAAGMAERTAAQIGTGPGDPRDISHGDAPWLWRPFLHEPRHEIETYVNRLGLTAIEDPSNEDRALRRNVLRHEVLPGLEKQIPGASAALARYAMLAAEDDRLLDDLAAAALTKAMGEDGRLVADRVREQPLALQRRLVRQWLSRGTGSAAFSADRTNAVLQLAGKDAGGRIEMGEGWMVCRERGMLRAMRLEQETDGGSE